MWRKAGRAESGICRRGLASALIVMLLPIAPLRAQAPAPPPADAPKTGDGIRHMPPDCVLAGEHAKLTACFDSVVARGRLVFRGGGLSNYYRIDMAPDDLKHGCVNGFLPKLKRRQARTHQGNAVVQYYIESTGRDLMSARTKLSDLRVVETAAECKGSVAQSVPEADVTPMPADPQDPPYSQVAQGSHWEAGPADAPEPDASASVSAPVSADKGGSGMIKLLLGTAAIAAAAIGVASAIEAAGSTSDGGSSGGGGGSGFCSATSQCAGVGSRCSGGSANVRCATDGLCHCCYDVNGRCQSCSASVPCIDRNTSCVTGVCVFNQGVRP